jgi:hypothetical protein
MNRAADYTQTPEPPRYFDAGSERKGVQDVRRVRGEQAPRTLQRLRFLVLPRLRASSIRRPEILFR